MLDLSTGRFPTVSWRLDAMSVMPYLSTVVDRGVSRHCEARQRTYFFFSFSYWVGNWNRINSTTMRDEEPQQDASQGYDYQALQSL